MNHVLVLLQIVLIICVSVYIILRSSFAMLQKQSIAFFMPFVVIGLEMCFEAGLFYFGTPLSELPGLLHDVAFLFLVVFYWFALGGMKKHA